MTADGRRDGDGTNHSSAHLTSAVVSALVSLAPVRHRSRSAARYAWAQVTEVADLGERISAVLERVWGQPLKSSNLLSSAIVTCVNVDLRC
jgi:hypothetical protein